MDLHLKVDLELIYGEIEVREKGKGKREKGKGKREKGKRMGSRAKDQGNRLRIQDPATSNQQRETSIQ
jgi:hypothetical protein